MTTDENGGSSNGDFGQGWSWTKILRALYSRLEINRDIGRTYFSRRFFAAVDRFGVKAREKRRVMLHELVRTFPRRILDLGIAEDRKIGKIFLVSVRQLIIRLCPNWEPPRGH